MRRKLLKLKNKFFKRVSAAGDWWTRFLRLRVYSLRTVKDYVAMEEKQRFSWRTAKILFQASAEDIGFDNIQDAESQTKISRSYVSGYKPYVAVLKNVRIIGNSSLVYGGHAAVINDTLADIEIGQFVDMRNDTHVLSQQEGALTAIVPKAKLTVDRAIHLSGLFAVHFGHWYAEYLPRLRHFENLDDFASIPILVNSNLPASHMELLRYFCDNQIIPIDDTDCVLVKELLVAPTITFCPPQFFPNHPVGAVRPMLTSLQKDSEAAPYATPN